MEIFQVVLLILTSGLVAQLVYQLRFRREVSWLGAGIALVNLMVVAVSIVSNETAIMSYSGPPPKFDLPVSANLSTHKIRACVSTIDLRRPFSVTVTPHSSGGFVVEIAGKGLMLSQEREGLWERVGFYLDKEVIDDQLRIQYVRLQGHSTFSNWDEIPPLGDRWIPFNSQAMARYTIRMDGFFAYLTDCLK